MWDYHRYLHINKVKGNCVSRRISGILFQLFKCHVDLTYLRLIKNLWGPFWHFANISLYTAFKVSLGHNLHVWEFSFMYTQKLHSKRIFFASPLRLHLTQSAQLWPRCVFFVQKKVLSATRQITLMNGRCEVVYLFIRQRLQMLHKSESLAHGKRRKMVKLFAMNATRWEEATCAIVKHTHKSLFRSCSFFFFIKNPYFMGIHRLASRTEPSDAAVSSESSQQKMFHRRLNFHLLSIYFY